MRFEFVPGGKSTIGVEWELALVDADTLELAPRAQRVLDGVDDPKAGPIRREYLTGMIELVTGVHHRVDEAMDELRGHLRHVQQASAMSARSSELNRRTPDSDFDSLVGSNPISAANATCVCPRCSMSVRTRSAVVVIHPTVDVSCDNRNTGLRSSQWLRECSSSLSPTWLSNLIHPPKQEAPTL